MALLIDDAWLLKDRIATGKDTLVLFYADWCHFSQAFLPFFEKHTSGDGCFRILADEVEGVEDAYKIDYFPTVIFFSKGKEHTRLDAEPGAGLDELKLVKLLRGLGLVKGNREKK